MAITSTNNLRKGSKGSDVTELQKALNATGWYTLDEDGSYGAKTEAAVKDYQQRSGLKVDGIVGTNTWGSLTSGQSASTSNSAAAAQAEPQAPTFSYTASDAVTQADAMLQQFMANKPGEWQGGAWADNLNETISQILNREKFSYDLNGDALYQQYKDQYTTQGKLAMMDAMGQAAAMSGGYGNSYAQTAGQQAYQGYLQQLNAVVPELYGMALDQYNQEGQALYDQASILAGMEEQEYGRYRDAVADYYTDLNYLTENARYMSETEYQKALDDFNIKYSSYWDQTNFDEGVRQYEKNFAYQQEQDAIANNLAQQQLKASQSKSTGGTKTGDEDNPATTGVSDSIRETLAGLKSNAAVEQRLENLEATGVIDHETALQLMAEFMDDNEVYKENDDGSKSVSYGDMVKSTNGWSVIDNGGINWGFGVDNDAILEAPNGEKIRLDNLVNKLVAEGMSKSDAKSLVKSLQNNLNV